MVVYIVFGGACSHVSLLLVALLFVSPPLSSSSCLRKLCCIFFQASVGLDLYFCGFVFLLSWTGFIGLDPDFVFVFSYS